MKSHVTVLLTETFVFPGMRCEKDAVFVYSRLGDDVLLQCTKLVSPDCSLISWTFYKGGGLWYSLEVSSGQVRVDSDKSSRMSITSTCSLSLRDLRVDDAGSYVCLKDRNAINNIYLSLLTITSLSTITNLQPGGNLTLNCILFTYYDAGNCKSYSSVFNLSWTAEDGAMLPKDSRFSVFCHFLTTVTTTFELNCVKVTFFFFLLKKNFLFVPRCLFVLV